MHESPGSIPVRMQCLEPLLVMEKDPDTLIQAGRHLRKPHLRGDPGIIGKPFWQPKQFPSGAPSGTAPT